MLRDAEVIAFIRPAWKETRPASGAQHRPVVPSWIYFPFIVSAALIKDITSAPKPALVSLPSRGGGGAAEGWGAQAAVTLGITSPWPWGTVLGWA